MAEATRTAAEEAPGPALAATLGLIALGFLPLAEGGYSGNGYQIGFVLLLVAAGIGWSVALRRPAFAAGVLLVYLLGGLFCFGWIQQGRLLWYYLLHIPAAWVCVWVLFNQVPNRSKYFLGVVTLSTVLTGVYGWFLWYGNGTLNYQITSTFGLHNAYAGYLLLAWPLAVIGYASAGNQRARVCFGLAVLFICATLVLTYSKASWLAFAGQLLVLAAVALQARLRRQRIEAPLAWLGGGLALLIVIALALPPVRAAIALIGNFNGYSMQGRLRFWTAALEIFRDHPWVGVGPGNFAYIYPQYQRDYMYYSVDPHSWPLQLLCELGLAGVSIGLLVAWGVIRWIRLVWSSRIPRIEAAALVAAVSGSLLHACVDFDYTFGATTALLGAVLAYGTYRALGDAAEGSPGQTVRVRLLGGLLVVLLFAVALFGEALTAERFCLDRLRTATAANLPLPLQRELLDQCIRYNPLNHSTHYQLASLIAGGGPPDSDARKAAMGHVDRALELNPRFPRALALKGLLSRPPWEGEKYLEQALELDPYNYPEHYFYYAQMARDDDTKRERLLHGMQMIPVDDPITPEHVRPTWYQLNPLFADWWFQLSQLAQNEGDRDLYRKRYVRFKVYCDEQKLTGQPGLQDL